MIKLNDMLESELTEETTIKIRDLIEAKTNNNVGTDVYETKIYLYSPKGLSVGVDFDGTTINAILKLAKYLAKN